MVGSDAADVDDSNVIVLYIYRSFSLQLSNEFCMVVGDLLPIIKRNWCVGGRFSYIVSNELRAEVLLCLQF